MKKEVNSLDSNKVYEYEDLEEFAYKFPTLTFNWNVIRICYELWRNDIIAVRKEDLKLHKIVGVGENYVNEMCVGRVVKTRRLFNAQMDAELIPYLQGEKSIMDKSNIALKRYVALNIACNSLAAEKKKVTLAFKGRGISKDKIDWSKQEEIVELEKWIKQQCNGDSEEELKALKEKVITLIKGCNLTDYYGEERIKTVYGRLKQYLEGRNDEKIRLSEHQEKIAYLLTAMHQMPYSMIEKLDDKNLEKLYGYIKMFYDKVEAEVKVREVKKIEQKFYKQITEPYVESKEKK